MTIALSTLPSGLRVLTDTVESVESVALGAFFGVGTRHEDMSENGLAHLVEHMMFKGTKTRSAQKIAEEIEGIGGHMNAYTGREITGYYFHVIRDHVPLTLDVLADMLQNSIFDPAELERERGVILQEIGMNADTPDDLIYDYFQDAAYPDQTLGAPILGTEPIVSTIPRDSIERYVRTHYTTKNLVISAAGNIAHDDFVHQVNSLFGTIPTTPAPAFSPARYAGGDRRAEKELEQAHLLFGFKGVPRTDDRYYTAVALAHILGGGMSSRLFQEIREKQGLVYNIHAFHSAYHDDGNFGIYAGTGPEHLPRLVETLTDELKKVQSDITPMEMTRTQKQMKANLLMARESMTTRADQNAKHLLFHNRVLCTNDLRARIDSISTQGVCDLARDIFATPPVLAALGPLACLPPYAVIAQRIRPAA